MNRREFVIGAVLVVPAASARADSPSVSPEAFGAVGNGVADDYLAFQRMASAINASGSGTVLLKRGANYFLGQRVTRSNKVSDVVFAGSSGLLIDGNGATISVKGDFRRENAATRSLCGLRFEDCANVTVRNLELAGNVQRMSRVVGLGEAAAHGLSFGGCSDVVIDNVTCRHFETDGLYIRASTKPDGSGRYWASRRFQVRNSRFLFNARQGVSVIQLRDGLFENCDFSFTGSIDERGSASVYGAHAPVSGVDVEPNSSPWAARRPVDVMTGNLRFRGCRMIRNVGSSFLAGQVIDGRNTIENVIVENCTMEASAASSSHHDMIFDVPGGEVRGCVLRLYDKPAYLGWYAPSAASPSFSGNSVYGTRSPLLIVRATQGAPVIKNNRFFGPGGDAGLLRIDNQRAAVGANVFGSSG